MTVDLLERAEVGPPRKDSVANARDCMPNESSLVVTLIESIAWA
jgi:hypothetical protein